jgi:hypothetical protein
MTVAREVTKNQFARTVEMFAEIAKEKVSVRLTDGEFWVYGSELATLRIFKKYAGCDDVSQGHSANLNTFYFRISTSFSGEMETA